MDGVASGPTDPAAGQLLFACEHCGAANGPNRTHCWLCHEPLRGASGSVTKAPVAPVSSFSLASLFLVVTLISVCLGVATVAPGLIVPLVIVVTLALIRTVAATSRHKSVGEGRDVLQKVSSFFVSVGVVLLVGLAALIAFNIACWSLCGLGMAAGASPDILGFSIGSGVLAAIVCAIWLLRKTWPK